MGSPHRHHAPWRRSAGRVRAAPQASPSRARCLTSRCTWRPRASAMSVASGHTIRGRLRARPQVGGHPLGGEKMSPYEVLLTLAEVGATLAALSAVAGVIESR